MEALGSPINEYEIKPPLITSLGLMPKNCGVHTTISAIFPVCNDPTYSEIPWVIAGLIVIFARYLLTRTLSLPFVSPLNLPVIFFILSAVCQALMVTSPTLPIAWLSDEYILSAPISCNTSSAAIVSALILDSAKATSSGIDGFK